MEEEKKNKHHSGCFKSLKTVFNASSRYSHGEKDMKKKKEDDEDIVVAKELEPAKEAKAAEAAMEADEKVVRLAGYPNSLEGGVQPINKKELEPHLIIRKGNSGESSRRKKRIVNEDRKLPNYMASTQSAEAKIRINMTRKTASKIVNWY